MTKNCMLPLIDCNAGLHFVQEEKKEEEKPAATAAATSEPMETEDPAAQAAAGPDGAAAYATPGTDPMQS